MTPRVRASQLVEDKTAIFLLSRLYSSFRLLFSCLIYPYPQVRHSRRDRRPPEEGEESAVLGLPPGLRVAMGVCDEWGGAESHGNGARPVELMMMNDSCTTHRSRVPRRSSRRIKVKDERGPGLDFYLCCVRQSSVRGCRFSFVFFYFIIKVL